MKYLKCNFFISILLLFLSSFTLSAFSDGHGPGDFGDRATSAEADAPVPDRPGPEYGAVGAGEVLIYARVQLGRDREAQLPLPSTGKIAFTGTEFEQKVFDRLMSPDRSFYLDLMEYTFQSNLLRDPEADDETKRDLIFVDIAYPKTIKDRYNVQFESAPDVDEIFLIGEAIRTVDHKVSPDHVPLIKSLINRASLIDGDVNAENDDDDEGPAERGDYHGTTSRLDE